MRVLTLAVKDGRGTVTEGLVVPETGRLVFGKTTVEIHGASPGEIAKHLILKTCPDDPDPPMSLRAVSDREDLQTNQGLVPFVLIHLVLFTPVNHFARGWGLTPCQHLRTFDSDSDSPLALIGDRGGLIAMPADLHDDQDSAIAFQLHGEECWIRYSEGEIQYHVGEAALSN